MWSARWRVLKDGYNITNFFCYKFFFLLLFNYSCPIVPPLLSPALPTPASHIQSSPIVFVHVSFLHGPWWPFPVFSLFFPLPSSHCQFVLYFHVSGSILLTFLFCWLVPLIGEITWYLSFTAWFISLSIILHMSLFIYHYHILSLEQYPI